MAAFGRSFRHNNFGAYRKVADWYGRQVDFRFDDQPSVDLVVGQSHEHESGRGKSLQLSTSYYHIDYY